MIEPAIMTAMREMMLNFRQVSILRQPLTRLFCLALLLAPPLMAQRERPALNITGYVIDAEIDTATHHLTARTEVSFTAPENLELVAFGFHPALKVTKITDDTGKLLTGERSADGTIRVAPGEPFVQAKVNHWTFEYD